MTETGKILISSPEPVTEEMVARYIGAPPGWYHPLVGRVATGTARLEHYVALAALVLLERPSDEAAFWSYDTGRLRTLIELVKGEDDAFDALCKQKGRVDQARARRNRIVHAAVFWVEVDDPDEPHGWYFQHPRTDGPVWLETRDAQRTLQTELVFVEQVSTDMFDVWKRLSAESPHARRAAIGRRLKALQDQDGF